MYRNVHIAVHNPAAIKPTVFNDRFRRMGRCFLIHDIEGGIMNLSTRIRSLEKRSPESDEARDRRLGRILRRTKPEDVFDTVNSWEPADRAYALSKRF